MNLDRCTPGQRDIITTQRGAMMVAAGAGSGKTFTLTQRVVYALLQHDGAQACLSSLDQVCAITFTKKAAAELKGRIKSLLLDEGLGSQALLVDDAWISTIHGMASRILRDNAVRLGLDPAFEVMDESAAQQVRAQAVERAVGKLEQTGDPLVRELLTDKSMHAQGYAKGIVERAQDIAAHVRSLPEGFDALEVAQPAVKPAALLRQAYELGLRLQATAHAWAKPGKREQDVASEVEGALASIEAWLAHDEAVGFLDERFDADGFRGAFYALPPTSAKFHANKEDADFFEGYRLAYAQLCEEVESSIASRQQQALLHVARLIEDEYACLKGPSRLDNDDLLVCCLQALEKHPSLSKKYRQRFKLIMVDEFQDTDTLQVALVKAIAHEGFANVCTVGDAQQSIYRFRGADVNVFFGYRDWLRANTPGARFVSLPDNFRSHADVLALADAIFSQPDVFGGEYLHLEARAALNQADDPLFQRRPRISVDVVHYKKPSGGKEGVLKGEALEVSASHIAQHFAALKAEGARAGDMALLLGSMSNADVYDQALRRVGIESVITGGSVFAASPEAQLVLSLLQYAANETDERALFSILCSDICAVSDDALLSLTVATNDGGSLRHTSFSRGFLDREWRGCDALSHPDRTALDHARRILSEFSTGAQRGGASAALRRLLVESGLFARLEHCGSVGLACAGNFSKAISLVADIEETSSGIASTAFAFAENLRCSKEAPGTLATIDSDFVRIMTVHASKGLEFPHVAIADLRNGKESRPALLVENVQGRTYVASSTSASGNFGKVVQKLRDFRNGAREREGHCGIRSNQTPGERYEALLDYATEQAMSEAQRLFYVAITRATRSVMVGCCLNEDPANEYAGSGIFRNLYSALRWDTSSDHSTSQCDFGGQRPAQVTFTYLKKPPETVGDEQPDPTACDLTAPTYCFPAMPHACPCSFGRENVRSYSSLAHGLVGHVPTEMTAGNPSQVGMESAPADVVCGFALDEDATALGLAFHRLAQRSILACANVPDERNRILECPNAQAIGVQVRQYSLNPAQEKRLHRALKTWFDSQTAHRFAAHCHIASEVGFMVTVADDERKLYLEGEIDGLADDGDGKAFLVDYKTGGHETETMDGLRKKHALQAQCYAYALMNEGYTQVEAHFVRVEQADAENPSQPQEVCYRFDQDDVPALRSIILDAYKQT